MAADVNTLAPPLEAALWAALSAGLTPSQVENIVELALEDWNRERAQDAVDGERLCSVLLAIPHPTGGHLDEHGVCQDCGYQNELEPDTRPIPLTPGQFIELSIFENGSEKNLGRRPNSNLIRRNLIQHVGYLQGPGWYMITPLGKAALEQHRKLDGVRVGTLDEGTEAMREP
jgi:hypothetical protein